DSEPSSRRFTPTSNDSVGSDSNTLNGVFTRLSVRPITFITASCSAIMTLTPDTGVRRAFLFALTMYSCGIFPRNLPRMFIHSLYGMPVNFISQPIPESLPHELQIAPPSPGVLRLSVQRKRSFPAQ